MNTCPNLNQPARERLIKRLLSEIFPVSPDSDDSDSDTKYETKRFLHPEPLANITLPWLATQTDVTAEQFEKLRDGPLYTLSTACHPDADLEELRQRYNITRSTWIRDNVPADEGAPQQISEWIRDLLGRSFGSESLRRVKNSVCLGLGSISDDDSDSVRSMKQLVLWVEITKASTFDTKVPTVFRSPQLSTYKSP